MKIQKIIYTIALVLLVNHAHAWSVSPMSSTLKPDTRTFSMTISNTGGEEMIAIKLSLKSRTQDIYSEEILTETKDLRVFPKQVIVQPGRTITVRGSVVIPNNSPYEKSYRLIAEALSVRRGVETDSGVQVLLKFITSIYLPPKNNQDVALEVGSAKLLGDELILDVANNSTQHQIMLVNEIFASIAGKEVNINNEDKLSNILSNSRMRMRIPITPKEYDVLKLSPIISLTNNCRACENEEKITLNLEQ
jgi:P pilus assembly chaperone PapD